MKMHAWIVEAVCASRRLVVRAANVLFASNKYANVGAVVALLAQEADIVIHCDVIDEPGMRCLFRVYLSCSRS